MSARELSIKANVSQSYISKLENNSMVPTVTVFARLVSVLQLTSFEINYIIKTLGQNDTTTTKD